MQISGPSKQPTESNFLWDQDILNFWQARAGTDLKINGVNPFMFTVKKERLVKTERPFL